jgi:hypothetical protein
LFVSEAEHILEQNCKVISTFSCFINRRTRPKEELGSQYSVASVMHSPVFKRFENTGSKMHASKFSTDSKPFLQTKGSSKGIETWDTERVETTLPGKSRNHQSGVFLANMTPGKAQQPKKAYFAFPDTAQANSVHREKGLLPVMSSDVLDTLGHCRVSGAQFEGNKSSKVAFNSSSKAKQHSKKYSIPDLSYLSPQTKPLSPLERFLHELSIKKWKMKSSSQNSNNY